jgi:hypothetical protein
MTAPQGCQYSDCRQDAMRGKPYCESHNNPFTRIAEQNHALSVLLNPNNPDWQRREALLKAFPNARLPPAEINR